MPGPNSLPEGDKAFWNELQDIVCDVHYDCHMQEVDKQGRAVYHEYITYREWLQRRNRLRTGKTR